MSISKKELTIGLAEVLAFLVSFEGLGVDWFFLLVVMFLKFNNLYMELVQEMKINSTHPSQKPNWKSPTKQNNTQQHIFPISNNKTTLLKCLSFQFDNIETSISSVQILPILWHLSQLATNAWASLNSEGK